MSQRHFQVIILGDSLASRLTGVLLAKRGVRVLSFQRNGLGTGLWFQSSLLLDRVLDHLGGRSCYAAPLPLQVITPESRLEFHGEYPLEEELRREFPADHPRVAAVLETLSGIAERVGDRLWQIGFLPLYGWCSRWRFRLRRPGLRGLDRPLSDLLAPLHGTPAHCALDTLFSGLSLVAMDRLSVFEAALLWDGAVQSRGVSPSGLDTLLRHRYEQFHGQQEDSGNIQSLSFQSGQLSEVVLKNGTRASADHVLIENPEIWPLLPDEWRKNLPPSAAPAVYAVSLEESRVSPLLAPRVILAGPPPLRLGLVVREGEVRCTVKGPLGDRQSTPGDIQRCLAPAFPLSPPLPVPLQAGAPAAEARKAPLPGARADLRLRGNALFCHAGAVFPTLGTTGEVLVGLSTANHLLRKMKQP